MRALVFRTLAVVTLLLACVASASAQTVITQWNFNNTGTGNNAFQAGSSGLVTGSAALARNFATMNAAAAPFATTLYNGALIDPGTVVSGTSFNRSLAPSIPSGTATNPNRSVGAAFTVSTASVPVGQPLTVSWSQTVGWRSSRYWQVVASTTGTAGPFNVVTGGVGSSVSQAVSGYNSGSNAISGTATAVVDSSGVIDFRTIDGNWLSPSVTTTGTVFTQPLNAGFVDNISFTLPANQGYENNPNFAFAILAIWDPSLVGATSNATGLVSSFSGLTLSDTTSGYNSVTASGGSARYDLVTVTAPIPEPSTCAMLGAAAVSCGAAAWRRRRRKSA